MASNPALVWLIALLLIDPTACAFAARSPKRSKGKGGRGRGGRSGFGRGSKRAASPSSAAAAESGSLDMPTTSPPVRAPTARELSFLQASPHNTGMALMAAGNYEEAGLAFEKALDENPDGLETWSALGVCMSELGQLDAALVCQKQVLRIRATTDHGSEEQAQEEEVSQLASEASHTCTRAHAHTCIHAHAHVCMHR